MRLKTVSVMLAASIGISLFANLAGAPAAYADSKNYVKINANAIGTNRRLNVGLNKSLVIDLPAEAHDILVANPEVADAITRTSKRIYVFAKQVGETNVFIFDNAGRQLLSIDLAIERDIDGLEAKIEKYVPGSDVKVEMVNDNVILTGTVPTPQASARAVELARIFVTGGEATTNAFNQNSSTTNSGSGSTIIFGSNEGPPGKPDRQPSAD
ncbi:MAG: pilus assembly protein N-terminal domain-containing protein [Nitratireductor sp.]